MADLKSNLSVTHVTTVLPYLFTGLMTSESPGVASGSEDTPLGSAAGMIQKAMETKNQKCEPRTSEKKCCK